jgi:hypothetical protein
LPEQEERFAGGELRVIASDGFYDSAPITIKLSKKQAQSK